MSLDYRSKLVMCTKFVLDMLASLVGLLILALLFPIIAILIKLDSRGPIFYRQLRIGQTFPHRTELIYIYKFRTMKQNAETQGKAVWAKKNDPRITKVGAFLRKTRIDELPQFINIMRREMSLIGPRPERPGFYLELENKIPFFAERAYGLLPGITGLSQIKVGYDESIESVKQKVAYDHAYAASLSKFIPWCKLESWIIFQTILTIIKCKGQ